MLRISTQTMFETGSGRISELQSGLSRTQLQIASGRRLLSPSDDPVATARALEVTQSKSINERYGVNRQYAMSSLEAVEGTLSSVTALLQDVKEITIAAGNPTLGDSERASQATALRSRFKDLLGLANSRDAAGDYMFSGFQSHTPAFVEGAPGVVSYQGDAGRRMVQVDTARQIAVTVTGDSVFKNATQDVFDTLNDLILLLETPGTAGLAAGLQTANDKLGLALDDVISARVSVGGDLQAIDFFEAAGQDKDLQYSQILSDLQDLDYAKAVTQLSQQQFMLEAAQKSFVKTSGLSLFNFL